MPSPGIAIPSGTSRLAVGMPRVVPRPAPLTTVPSRTKGRPRRPLTAPTSPAASSSRMVVLLTAPPLSLRSWTTVTEKSISFPMFFSVFTFPSRRWPMAKSGPATMPAVFRCRWRSDTKSRARSVARSRSKVMGATKSTPSSRSSLTRLAQAGEVLWPEGRIEQLRGVGTEGDDSGDASLRRCLFDEPGYEVTVAPVDAVEDADRDQRGAVDPGGGELIVDSHVVECAVSVVGRTSGNHASTGLTHRQPALALPGGLRWRRRARLDGRTAAAPRLTRNTASRRLMRSAATP